MITIGFVNNMPDAALRSTERRFRELVLTALPGHQVCLRQYHLPEVPRGDAALSYLEQNYRPVGELWRSRIDGLIVTGTQPVAADLTAEPYWDAFTRLVDWARHSTVSTLWSCLAAHAAVLHLDGIQRAPLRAKLSGVFECRKVADHPLLSGLPGRWPVPHSRHNGVDENRLARAGYRLLSTSGRTGADMFVKHCGSLFIFLQGHPEYDRGALAREYSRDVSRFLAGRLDRFPPTPAKYFNRETNAALAGFRRRARRAGDGELRDAFPADLAASVAAPPWHRWASRIFTNWLFYLETNAAGPRPDPDPMPLPGTISPIGEHGHDITSGL